MNNNHQEWHKLEQDKIKARKALEKLNPQEAQNLVNQTLYPELWQLDLSSSSWEETIPTNYEEIDT
jgi:hypothetical protein